MKILISATYFHPYSSGLSVYALRLAEGLADLGHEVVVLTSQHERKLRLHESFGKFQVVRIPINMRLSKGVIMTTLPRIARKWIGWADIVNLHLPQFEAFILSKIAAGLGKPVVVTYHCDLVMSGGMINKLAGKVTTALSKNTLDSAALIVQNSLDYAENSPVLSRYLENVVESPTPITVNTVTKERTRQFRSDHGIAETDKVIGLAGRVAAEKGYEYLAMALPKILDRYPNARVVHAGAWKSVIGEQDYQEQLEEFIKPFGQKWKSLGFLSDEEFEAFFSVCDLLVFSSLNATESFGIVQLEAMSQGTPIVASDLPGVRQPVSRTGLGEIIPIRNADAIAEAVISILDKGGKARFVPADYLAGFQQKAVAQRYEAWMEAIVEDE